MSETVVLEPVAELAGEAPKGTAVTKALSPRTLDLAVLGIVFGLAATIAWMRLRRGWIPHDDGMLGHSAERVLLGELPHTEFDEVYTGGLSFFHAAIFRVFGMDLVYLRMGIYAIFLMTVPATYYLCRRFLQPAGAGVATMLAVILGFPNYAAAMPSWYLLFLSIFAAAAMTRYDVTRNQRWIALAGVTIGVACTIKITGLYLLAAILAHILFISQSRQGTELTIGARRTWSAFVVLCLAVLIAAVFMLVAPRLTTAEFLHLVLPALAVTVLLAEREWTSHATRERVTFAVTAAAILIAGMILPILVLLVPYVLDGSVGALVNGVFMTNAPRLTVAAMRPPGMATVVAALPILAILAISRIAMPERRKAAIILAVGLAAICMLAGNVFVYRSIWLSIRWCGPLAVLVAAWLLRRRPSPVPGFDSTLAMAASLVAFTGLNQFPFSAAIYFLYIAPLVVVVMGGIFARLEVAPRVAAAVLATFFASYTVIWVYPGYLHNMELYFAYEIQDTPMQLERASINVRSVDQRQYSELVALLREKTSNEYVYVGPDSPEVYFLAGLRNPTRHIFDFLSGSDHETAILDGLDRHSVDAIAIKRWAQFSEFADGFSADLIEELRRRYPDATQVGQFEVRWRE